MSFRDLIFEIFYEMLQWYYKMADFYTILDLE